MSFGGACSKTGSGEDGFNTMYSRLGKIKINPEAMTEMLNQGILWKSSSSSSKDTANNIKKNGLKGIRDAGENLAKSKEFKQEVKDKYAADDILKNFTRTFLKADPTNQDRSRFLRKINDKKSDQVVRTLLTDNRFYIRLLNEQQTAARSQTVPADYTDPVDHTPVIVTPGGGNPPAGTSCNAPPMPECGGPEGPKGVWGCCTEHATPTLEHVVIRAIDQIQAEQPGLFSGNRVLNETAYMQGVVRILQSYGYCATHGGPEDEVGIKTNNSFSEQYDILLSSGHIRRSGFAVTCRAARF